MKDWLTKYAERAKKKHKKKKTKEQILIEEAVKRNQKNTEKARFNYYHK